jgi:predicted metal-dependent HD superfamily phosphohydrolase
LGALEAMTEPSYDECLVEAELRARAAYSEPHRHYHDQRHLDECLKELDWVQGLNERDLRVLKWAILWHDSVYDPGQRDNEKRSANLARSELERCGVPVEDAAEVARLIHATASHRTDPGDSLGRLIISIDLAVLGSDQQRYADYAAAVRREYAHVPEPLWRTGRELVLKRLLDCDPLYPDPGFASRLEARARRNLESEIKALGEG